MTPERDTASAVLIVTTSYPRGEGDAAGHFVASLARELARAGMRVTVLAPHAAGLAHEEEADGVRVRRFRYLPEAAERVAYGDGIPTNIRRDKLAALGLPAFAIALRAAARRLAADADVVHVQWAPTAAIAGSALAGRPVVVTLHGSDTTLARRGRVWRWLLARGLAVADAVVAVSRDQAALLAGDGLWDGPVDVVPSGVPASLLDRARAGTGSDATAFTYLFVGRLVPEKGPADLVEAFRLVSATRPGARLRLVGAGPEEERLRAMVTDTAIDDAVVFAGAVSHDEALDEIARADALVLPSHGEGSPLSVTEALALGTPVVGTRVGGVPDLLGDDGLVVEPGDVAGLAQAMGRIADDPALRARLGDEGRARVRAGYTWDAVAERVRAVYDAAVAVAPGRARRPSAASWPLRAARAALLLVVAYFAYGAVARQLAASRFLELHFSLPHLLAAWAVIACYYLLFAGGLLLVVRAMGHRPRYRDVFKLSFAANLGKYLPGGFWQVAGKVAMARQAGIDRHVALVATTVETAVSVTAGLLVFMVSTLLGSPLPAGVPTWPILALVVAVLVALQPAVFARVVGLGMRLLRIDGEPPHLGLTRIAALVGYYALAWLVAGGGFWLFTRSLTGDPGAGWLAYAGFYAAGAVGGLLVLFAPAGLGAREGFLVLLTRDVVAGGAGTAWIVAFAARVWSTAMELVMSAVAVALPFAGTARDADGDAP